MSPLAPQNASGPSTAAMTEVEARGKNCQALHLHIPGGGEPPDIITFAGRYFILVEPQAMHYQEVNQPTNAYRRS